jgi:hypothetical protein
MSTSRAALCANSRARESPEDRPVGDRGYQLVHRDSVGNRVCESPPQGVTACRSQTRARSTRAGDLSYDPIPLRGTSCGAFTALSLIVMIPAAPPFCIGVKVTNILQALPGSSSKQVLVSEKPGVTAILDTVTATVPVFDRLTVFGLLVDPRRSFPKLTVVGLTETVPAGVAVAVGVAVVVIVAVRVTVDVAVAVEVAVAVGDAVAVAVAVGVNVAVEVAVAV